MVRAAIVRGHAMAGLYISLLGSIQLKSPVPMVTSAKEIKKCIHVPDKRSRILEVVVVRRLLTWVLGIWSGEGMGKG
jgi:hypothetical protein